jgi:hypothetical protein
MTPAPSPFRILGVQQLAVGGVKQALAKLWVELLNIPRVGQFRSEAENASRST